MGRLELNIEEMMFVRLSTKISHFVLINNKNMATMVIIWNFENLLYVQMNC